MLAAAASPMPVCVLLLVFLLPALLLSATPFNPSTSPSLPPPDGDIQLDGAVMRGTDCGFGAAVAVRGHARVAALALEVLQHSRHSVLCGAGAEAFALERGWTPENLHTPESLAKLAAFRRDASSVNTGFPVRLHLIPITPIFSQLRDLVSNPTSGHHCPRYAWLCGLRRCRPRGGCDDHVGNVFQTRRAGR